MDRTLFTLICLVIVQGSLAVFDDQCENVNQPPAEPVNDAGAVVCQGMFNCGDDQCIAYSLVCDGNFDCTNTEGDEENCAIQSGVCGVTDLWCANRAIISECVLAGKFCDGIEDCSNGGDEDGSCNDPSCPAPTRLCPDTEVLCSDGLQCISAAGWCTGAAPACTDGSDETTGTGSSCTKTCGDCPTATVTPTPDMGCKPVYWDPPAPETSMIRVYEDCLHFPHTTFPPGEVTTVTYTFETDDGFQNYCKFEVEVPANPCNPPVTGCPNENLIVTADNSAQNAIVNYGDVESSDSVATVEIISGEDTRSGSTFPCGYTRIVHKITKDDDVSWCIFYIHVKCNSEAVAAICELSPIVVILNPPEETASVESQLRTQMAGVFDDAGVIVSNTTSHALDFQFSLGLNVFVLTLVDNSGNSHSCTTTITVERPFDDIAPNLLCPSDTTICHHEVDDVVKGSWVEPNPTDNVYLPPGSFYGDHSPENYLEIPDSGQTAVTYRATDWNGNEAECSFFLFFEVDDQDPYITNCNNYTEYTTETDGTILVNYPEPDITDNCDEYQVTVTPTRDTRFAVESITRVTYQVTDKAGNMAECSFTVQVKIDQYPTFDDCPESWVASTDPGTTYTEVEWEPPQVQDDNQLNANNVELTVTPSLPVSLDPLEDHTQTLEKGVYTVTYSYTDVNLQKRICTFTITVQDAEAPTFGYCPPDMERTLNAIDIDTVVEWEQPTAEDNDRGEVDIQIEDVKYQSGEPFRSGMYSIIYRAVDQTGNEGFCNFILTVNAYNTGNFWVDCPDDIEIPSDPGLPYSVVVWDPPQLRAGVDRPRWSQTHSAGSNFVIGDTRTEYTAFDRADNSDTCAFTVSVVDEEPPVIISCPGDSRSYGLSGRDTVPVFWLDPRTSDNSGSTVSLNASPLGAGSDFGFGTHQVYYSAVDSSGNSASGCHFQITVSLIQDAFLVSGSAQFSSVRGADSASAIAEAPNLADDLDTLLRRNTAISGIIAGVQVGTPSPLSDGDVLVPFNLFFAECRAAFLHVRDSLTQNLEGNNRDSFDTNNVIYPDTFQLNTKEFLVSLLTIDRDLDLPFGQQELIYNGDYNNPRTTAYRNLADRICDVMDILFSSFTGYCGCSIWLFRQGSIVADLVLIFADGSSVSQSALYDQISNSIDLSNGEYNLYNLILEGFDLTTVTEVCPEGYCQNGGTCEPNAATYLSQCRCTPDYTGTQCQTPSVIVDPVEPPIDGPDTGLTTELIIGIVVGTVGGLLLLIILLACCCVFCLRPSPEPKPQPIIQEPPEPFYAVQQQPQDVVFHDLVEPPPIPRQVPIHVPHRFPVPVPIREPVPVPRPVPRPFPVPFRHPVPVPFPVRVPVPTPVARPFPVPVRQPFPVAQRFPVPVRYPVQVPTPVRVPVPVGVPVREQVPVFGPSGFGGNVRLGNNLTGYNPGFNGGVVLNGGVPVTGFTHGLNGFNSTRF